MSLFSKVKQGANKLFSKVGGNDPNFFRKVSNTARKVDNSVARVGHFLASTAHSLGAPQMVSDGILSVAKGTHDVRNNLEKSIHTPIGDIRKDIYS